jgi:hypothetical protein
MVQFCLYLGDWPSGKATAVRGCKPSKSLLVPLRDQNVTQYV